jgi:hypothetical protein
VETLEKVGQRAKSVNRKKIEKGKWESENREDDGFPGESATASIKQVTVAFERARRSDSV